MNVTPLFVALAAWFLGTAGIVWLVSRPRATHATSLAILGVAAVFATGATHVITNDASAGAAYLGFTLAVLIWGWHELAFLTGAVSGPSKDPCPAGATGWRRFAAATATVIHHEMALAATAILLFALSWGQPNQAAALTFGLLFVLRLSAKFNLYLGVPNLSDEVFPEHLAHLKTYFRKARMNALFPLSIALGGGLAAWAWIAGAAAPAGSGAAVTGLLLCGMALLGVIEHLLLAMPLRDAKMWRWAVSNNRAAPAATTE